MNSEGKNQPLPSKQLFSYYTFKARKLFLFFLLFRIINALFVNSFFDPDEYWQSMEVAHNFVFGYGYLTWEWAQAIRSFIHPAIFSIGYFILKLFRIDFPWLVQWTPRFTQAFFLAIQDISIYSLSLRLFPITQNNSDRFNLEVGKWTVICQVFSWFTWYCGIRTYSNCLEGVLILLGLLYWPLPYERATRSQLYLALFYAGFSVAIRPTAGIFWAILTLYILIGPYSIPKLKFLFYAFVMGLLWIGILLISDRLFFGYWVFVPLNFLKFNVIRGVSDFYGTHPAHWYFSNALPVILLSLLPAFIFGCFQLLKTLFTVSVQPPEKHRGGFLLVCIFGYILFFSVLGHKEFRFLYPILPLMLLVSGYGITSFLQKFKIPGIKKSWKFVIIVLLLLPNIPMAIYFSSYHQVGTIQAVEYIRKHEEVHSAYFLLPCHQTPFYAFIHRPISLRFPTCAPPTGEDYSLVNYQTETSQFLKNPLEFTYSLFPTTGMPTHIVTYDKIAQKIQPFFKDFKYQEVRIS